MANCPGTAKRIERIKWRLFVVVALVLFWAMAFAALSHIWHLYVKHLAG